MIKRVALFILLFVVLLVTFFQIIGSNVDELKESYEFKNSETQNLLIYQLQKKNINFIIDDKNKIWFSPKYSKIIHEIAEDVMTSAQPTATSFGYSDPEYTDLLEKRLKEEGVPYEKIILNEQRALRLNYSDKPKWGSLKGEIDELFIQSKEK